MGGYNMATKQAFDSTLPDQDLDMFVMGWIQGFNSAPAGYRYTTITRENITVCDSASFLQVNGYIPVLRPHFPRAQSTKVSSCFQHTNDAAIMQIKQR
jgi:hypothetical protein